MALTRRLPLTDSVNTASQRLAPGRYLMRVSAAGFSVRSGIIVDVRAGRSTTHNVQLEIAMVEQQVEILAGSVVDVDPSSNASALTLSGSALQTLSDDPDDLAQDLQMLAGPSTGPSAAENYLSMAFPARSCRPNPQSGRSA